MTQSVQPVVHGGTYRFHLCCCVSYPIIGCSHTKASSPTKEKEHMSTSRKRKRQVDPEVEQSPLKSLHQEKSPDACNRTSNISTVRRSRMKSTQS